MLDGFLKLIYSQGILHFHKKYATVALSYAMLLFYYRNVNHMLNSKYRELIASEFKNCVLNTIERVESNPRTFRPFHSALLSNEAIFWSCFERSFSTSFGQRVIEELARIVVMSNGATCAQRQRETNIEIDAAYNNSISVHIQNLRSNKCKNIDWNSSLAEIRAAVTSGYYVKVRIISDLWWHKDGIDHFVSLKTVKPNIDQTAIAKEDCLRLSVANPRCKVFFGLPYNPYGPNKENYNFSPPMRIFDFKHDEVVLIGKELWDELGGRGCYEEILEIARQVGVDTKPVINDMRSKCLCF